MTVTTWADGYGVWHARVSRHAASPIIAVRGALRDELQAREKNLDRNVYMHPERVPDLDNSETLVYREGRPAGYQPEAAPVPAATLSMLLQRAQQTAKSDSNDDEIEALQDALHEACKQLGIDPANPDAPRNKPQVIVIENPQEDPTWVVLSGDVDVSTMSSFPFSKYADAEAAQQETEEYLEVLRSGSGSPEFLAWLPEWLKDELGARDRDFEVDWDKLTIRNINTESEDNHERD